MYNIVYPEPGVNSKIKNIKKVDFALPNTLKSLKKDKSFLDEAFGFIDKCGAKPRIFNQNQSQSHQKRLFLLTLTEVRGFSPRTIYGRRSLPSKKDFDFKEFDFKRF